MALALALSGCGSGGDSPNGTLVVDWTVAGSKRTAACRDFDADSIDIVVRTSDGYFVDEVSDYCESFALGITLPSDSYTIDAVLLDVAGNELTTPATDRLGVYRYETSVSAIDFPADAFY